jgi:anti-sigma factor ChrR (cupin superfamily)
MAENIVPERPLTDELLAELALGLGAVDAPAGLDLRVGEKLRARMAAAAPIRAQRAQAARWIELCQGICVRVLRHDRKAGRLTAIWRLAPGTSLPSHPHDRDEECLILDGDIRHENEVYRAGDYMVAPAGSMHHVLSSVSGCSMLISGSDLPLRAQLA